MNPLLEYYWLPLKYPDIWIPVDTNILKFSWYLSVVSFKNPLISSIDWYEFWKNSLASFNDFFSKYSLCFIKKSSKLFDRTKKMCYYIDTLNNVL